MKFLGRNFKRIALGAVAVVVVLLLVYASFVWSSGARLQRRYAALRAAGEPVFLPELARSIPEEKNAAVFLRRAAADAALMHGVLESWYPNRVYPTGPMSQADQDRMETLFSEHPQFMSLLEQAAASPDYAPVLDYTLSPALLLTPFQDVIARHRQVSRVLRAYSSLRLAQGRGDDALAAQVLALRLTRHWRRDPLLIGFMVSLACGSSAIEGANQVLQAGPVSPAARRELDAELARHDDLEGLRGALLTERAYCLSSQKELPGSGVFRVIGVQDSLALRSLDLFDRHLENLSRTRSEVASGAFPTAPPRNVLFPLERLVDMLDPALAAGRDAAERTRAAVRCLRVLNALQPHVPRDGDHAPKLEELGLPGTALLDPFNDAPLKLTKRPEGWTVYSVGRDGVDGGGAIGAGGDVGVGPIVPDEAKEKADAEAEETSLPNEGQDEEASEPSDRPEPSGGKSPPALPRSGVVD